MLVVLAFLVALGCVLAAARRLSLAADATTYDPVALLAAWRAADDGRQDAIRRAVAREGPPWEAEVFAALDEADPAARDAVLEEQLIELDWRAHRWARVPRVCASIATSGGFLFASVAALEGLAVPAGVTPDLGATLFAAVGAMAVGIAGAVFCVFVHLRVRRLVRERVAAAGRLVAALSSGTS
jgi:hypothetical protein